MYQQPGPPPPALGQSSSAAPQKPFPLSGEFPQSYAGYAQPGQTQAYSHTQAHQQFGQPANQHNYTNGINQFPGSGQLPQPSPVPAHPLANGAINAAFPHTAPLPTVPVSAPFSSRPISSTATPTSAAALPPQSGQYAHASSAAVSAFPTPHIFSSNGSSSAMAPSPAAFPSPAQLAQPLQSPPQPISAFQLPGPPPIRPSSSQPLPTQPGPPLIVSSVYGQQQQPPPVTASTVTSLPRPPTSTPSAAFPQPPPMPSGQSYTNQPIPHMPQMGYMQRPAYSSPLSPPTSLPQPSSQPAAYAQPGPGPGQFGQPHQPTGAYPNQPQQINAMQQRFGNMNLGSSAQPGMGYGSNAASPIVDLLTEKNIMRYGFDDIEYHLSGHMANLEARVDPAIMRSTLYVIPHTEEILNKSRLPFGITLQPFRDVRNLNIIQTSNIVRCRYCRTYINPYVVFPDSRHWRCNLCSRSNDLPDDFSWDPVKKAFGDPTNRPEIQNATVEYIAPNEYMVRPPQPAVYMFIFDVSEEAVRTGYLQAVSDQLLINLDMMPGDARTLVSFVAVDNAIHFFQFPGSNKFPTELVVEDPEDIFLPTNSGLLVNLQKNKDAVRWLVKKLPETFERPPAGNANALGAALNIVHELMEEIGGRITVFQVSLPNVGPGALTLREDPNQRAAEEVQNLGPATDFYKRLALTCTGHQIAIDLFLLNRQYADLATLSDVAKYSTGCIYHFPNFDFVNDVYQLRRFEKIFTRYLTRKIGFEAVLRIRCSKGLSLSNFHGNFFVRSTDLLSLANVNPDSAIAVQAVIEEKLQSSACFQAALLYTSSKGDRRIRVHTICLPTSGDLQKIYENFDLKAAISLLVKIGVDRTMTGQPIQDSREAIINAAIDSLGSYARTIGQGRQGLLAPREGHLKHFPHYALAMLKHMAFATGRSIKLDERAAAMLMFRFSPLEQILSELYPKLYRLNELAKEPVGKDENGEDIVEWPTPLPASFEYIHRDGVYLLETGSALYLYISSYSDPQFLRAAFGMDYNNFKQFSTDEPSSGVGNRVQAFIKRVIGLKFYLGPLVVIKEDSPNRERFIRRLVDDRSEATFSYVEFVNYIRREMQK